MYLGLNNRDYGVYNIIFYDKHGIVIDADFRRP
jgi:hypothetical protein